MVNPTPGSRMGLYRTEPLLRFSPVRVWNDPLSQLLLLIAMIQLR
jgi:hypothetical protein